MNLRLDSAEPGQLVRSQRRIDLATEPMAKPELQENGWLRCEAVLTKTGIFRYRNADGTERRELRLPDEVFHPESVASFHLVPVTDDHPDVGWLDAQNARQYQCGSADMPRQDRDKMRAKLLITDAGLVAKIMNGNKAQISNGYFADLEMRSGEYEGEAFDAIQRNIRGNHVAVVDEARAGPEARIKLDAADAIMVRSSHGADPVPEPQRAAHVKIRIDEVEFEAPDQTVQAFQRKLDKTREKLAERDAKVEQLTAENGALQGKADALEKEVAKVREAYKAATDPKRLDALAQARADLIAQAREVLGDEFKADGKSDTAIKAEVVQTLSPGLKLDGKDAGYIVAAYDALIASRQDDGRDDALSRARGAMDPPHPREEPRRDEEDPAVKAARAQQLLWQKPLAASRRDGRVDIKK